MRGMPALSCPRRFLRARYIPASKVRPTRRGVSANKVRPTGRGASRRARCPPPAKYIPQSKVCPPARCIPHSKACFVECAQNQRLRGVKRWFCAHSTRRGHAGRRGYACGCGYAGRRGYAGGRANAHSTRACGRVGTGWRTSAFGSVRAGMRARVGTGRRACARAFRSVRAGTCPCVRPDPYPRARRRYTIALKNTRVKTAPVTSPLASRAFSAVRVPPCAATRLLASERPMPTPTGATSLDSTASARLPR